MVDVTRLGELGLIELIRARSGSRNNAVRLGIGDDCAVLRVPPGHDMLVTTDFSLEGRHFRRDWHSPQSVGHRCLARGLSDVAAMGGRPLAAFLSLALPKEFDAGWVEAFLEGFGGLAARFGVELAGGDTSQAPGGDILADVMVIGAVVEGKALRRSGSQPGDLLYVTGSLGGSAAELAALAAGSVWPPEAGQPQTFPEPRVAVGLVLTDVATACMDISDGLSTDLRHLCVASGVHAEVVEEAIPRGAGASLEQALDGGEDYELLFAARPWTEVPATIGGVNVSAIGRFVESCADRPMVRMMDAAGQWAELKAGGWEHFRG